MAESRSSRVSHHEWFAPTHWSLVVNAKARESTAARVALEELCRTYWYPLYAYVRRTGRSPHDAQDLVQGFFDACLQKNHFDAADRGKGRFRSFLLVALKRFLANEWDKERARKRGGDIDHISLDALTAEERYALEPADRFTTERLYERGWALTLLDRVLVRLGEEQTGSARSRAFTLLKEFLMSGGRGTPYADLAAQLNMSEGAVKVAVHRLRQRYRALLEEEIANTVESPQDVDAERRHLLSALSG